MRRAIFVAIVSLLSGFALLHPVPAAAQQASVAGAVTDGSGAVLPGVVVEASSAALIEKTRSVVTDGTGGAAALDGIKVSGKTGTAELRTTVKEEPPPEVTDPAQPPEDDTSDTDAWFVAFAPYRKPTIAVSVMLVGQGAGGDTAAPAAGAVLKAALS